MHPKSSQHIAGTDYPRGVPVRTSETPLKCAPGLKKSCENQADIIIGREVGDENPEGGNAL